MKKILKAAALAGLLGFIGGLTTIALASEISNRKIEEFVVVSYRELLKDLKKGDGPYLSSLLSSLEIPPQDKSVAVKKIKALLEIYPEIPEFAERVTDLRQGSPQAVAPESTKPVVVMKAYSGNQIEPMLDHAPKGVPMKVTLKSGGVFEGTYDQFFDDKLWLKSPVRSFLITKIKTVEVAQP